LTPHPFCSRQRPWSVLGLLESRVIHNLSNGKDETEQSGPD